MLASSSSSSTIQSMQTLQEKMENIDLEIAGLESVLKQMSTIFFAFISKPEIDLSNLLEAAKLQIKEHCRYKVVVSHEDEIKFGEISVSLQPPLVV
jgi:hypothetical protein